MNFHPYSMLVRAYRPVSTSFIRVSCWATVCGVHFHRCPMFHTIIFLCYFESSSTTLLPVPSITCQIGSKTFLCPTLIVFRSLLSNYVLGFYLFSPYILQIYLWLQFTPSMLSIGPCIMRAMGNQPRSLASVAI